MGYRDEKEARRIKSEAREIDALIEKASEEKLRSIVSSIFSDVSCDVELHHRYPPYYDLGDTDKQYAEDEARISVKTDIYESIRDQIKRED